MPITVQCPAITAPDNGTLELTGPFSLGTIATYSCDLGLVSGDRVRYCVANGTWTGTEPTCATGWALLTTSLSFNKKSWSSCERVRVIPLLYSKIGVYRGIVKFL